LVQAEITSTFLLSRVKEKFLTSYVLGRFHSPSEDLTTNISSVVAAADILGFQGSESQLVDRLLQNVHPRMKSYFLFVTKPESVRDVYALTTTVAVAFAKFTNAKDFSVLEFGILSAKSRKVRAFCTPFGLFEFNTLPMGVSIGCQTLSRVLDTLFGGLKGKFLYNFMDDLVVYSTSFSEHLNQLREIFVRLERAGFVLNRDKLHLVQREISFLGHSLSAERIKSITRTSGNDQKSSPEISRPCVDFLAWMNFMVGSFKVSLRLRSRFTR
jgi:hypothetical protein